MAISENSRKYPYHTTGGILDFRGRGGWEEGGEAGNTVWNSKRLGGGGGRGG